MSQIRLALLAAISAAVALSSFDARAAAPPMVALHPSEVLEGSDQDSARVHAVVVEEFSRRGPLAAPDVVKKAIASSGSCTALDEQERLSCLGALAQRVGADRAILISIAPWAGDKMILSAQSVSAKGKLLEEVPPFTRARPSQAKLHEEIQAAIRDFIPRIPLEPLPPEVVVEPVAATTTRPVETAVVTPSPQSLAPPPESGGLKRTAGYALAGAGVLMLGAGGYGFVDANAAAGSWNALRANGSPSPEVDEELTLLRGRVQRGQTLGTAGTIAGAAALAGGLYLAFSAPSYGATTTTPSPAATVRLELGPSYAGISGVLP